MSNPSRRIHTLVTITAAVVVLTGGAGFLGWIAGSVPLVQPLADVSAVQPTAAAALALFGTGILLSLHHRHRASALAGMAIFAIAGAEGLTYIWPRWAALRSGGVDALRLAVPGVAPLPIFEGGVIGFLLVGVALSCGWPAGASRRSRLVSGTLGACISALGQFGLVGPFIGVSGFSSWYALLGMAFHAAIGLALGGAALLILAAAPEWRSGVLVPSWAPLPVAAGVATLVVTFAVSLHIRESSQERLLLVRAAQGLSLAFQNAAELQIRALERMADRAGTQVAGYGDEWQRDSRAYLRDFSTFRALLWLDANKSVQGFVSQSGEQVDATTYAATLLVAIPARKEMTNTAIGLARRISVLRGQAGARFDIVVLAPTWVRGKLDGTMVGQLDVTDLLVQQVANGPNWNVDADLRVDDQPIASTNPSGPPPGALIAAEVALRLRDIRMQLRVTPGPTFRVGFASALPGFALVAGLAVSLLLGVSLFYALQVRDSSRNLDAANRALESDIRARRSAERELLELNDNLERKVEARAAELRRTVQALTESEQRIRNVVESAPNALLMADRQGRITLVNRNVENLFGYSRDELIGSEISVLLPERLRGRHGEYVRRYFENPQTRAMGAGRELSGVRKDGQEFPVEIGLSPIETREGTFALASIVDITDRVRANAQFRSIVESSPNALIVVNRDSQIQLVSRNLELMFGHTREELIGRSVEKLVPERFRGSHSQRVKGFFDNPTVRPMGANLRLCGLHRNGREIPIELGLSPIETSMGLFALGSISDISERVEGERLLRESEARFRGLIEQTHLPMAVHRGLKLLFVNKAFAAMFGFGSSDESMRIPSLAVTMLPEDVRRLEDQFSRRVAGQGGPESYERVGLRCDGKRMHLTVVPTQIEWDGTTAVISAYVDITQRKEAEERLRQNQSLLQAMFDALPVRIAVKDAGLRFLLVNRAMSEGDQLPGDWYRGRTTEDLPFASAEQKRDVAELDRSAIETGKGVHVPGLQTTLSDGLTHYFDSFRVPTKDEDGNVTGLIAASLDITDRIRAEQELRASEARFRGLIEQTSLPVLVHREFRALFANEAYANLFGYPSRDAVMEEPDVRATMLPEDVSDRETGHHERMRGDRPMGSEVRAAVRVDGARFWIQATSSRIDWEGVPAAVVFYQDVSSRITAEQKLRESQRLLSTVFESLPVRLSVKDKQGRYLLVNRELAAQDQLDPSWYAGKTIDDQPTLTAEEREKGWAGDLLVLKTGEVLRDPDFAMTLADGTSHIFESVRVPLKDESGQTTGLVVIAIDVTEQRALREQMQATQRLETVGRLAGGMAHDFNNILAVIMNYAQFLSEDHAGNKQAQEDAKQIVHASERGAALIRQLLAFSRKQVQRLDLLDLNEVIASMEPMLRRLIGEDIALHVRAGTELGNVMADISQIEQVLMNLVANARDAMPEGGNVTIETGNTELDETHGKLKSGTVPGRYVLLAVSDTGTGMSEQVKSRIFEPFFTTKETGKGTGLGLATVYGIVKQTGGQVWVYSEPGMGTTFKIYLPMTDASGDSHAVTLAAPSPGGTETILLVEDEPMVRSVARRILENAGYRVIDAGSGEEAIACAGKAPNGIDLLLTDVVMPRMSGRNLSDRLRENRPHLRVLYMSGYTEDAIVHHGVLEQDVLLVQKPFTREMLLQMVRTAIQTAPA